MSTTLSSSTQRSRTLARSSLEFKQQIPIWGIVAAHIVLLLILGSSFLVGEHHNPLNGDLTGYAKIAEDMNRISRGENSLYEGFYHYLPLANITFMIAGKNSLGLLPFDWGLLFTKILCAIGGIFFIVEYLKPADLRWTYLAILLSIVLLEPSTFFARFDFFPMLAMMLCALSIRREQYALAGVMLGSAIMLKFAPVFLLPLCFVLIPKSKRLTFLLSMTMLGVAVWGVYDLMLGWGATWDALVHFVLLRQKQMIYVFSTFSSIDAFLRMFMTSSPNIVWIDPILGHFNTDFPHILPNVLQLLSLVGAIIIARIASRDSNRTDGIFLYFAGTIFWLLFSTSFTTMHYYLWALPFVFLWCLERKELTPKHPWILPLAVLASLIALIGQYCFPYSYVDLVDQRGWLPNTMNLLRNLLVFALSIACLKAAAYLPIKTTRS